MESLVLPGIESDYDRQRAQDEMPQSAAGKTVMTTEPKFIPDEAVKISVDGAINLSVKMVDCVGYVVSGALGQTEDGKPRMVITPWSEEPMPFEEAAEIGTKKVITDHSTIGILVTSDGSVCDIPREDYALAEERVARELKEINKPFAVILNSAHPESAEAEELALSLEEKYSAPVALVNCLELDGEDIRHILELVLYEFPITELSVDIPAWAKALDESHPIYSSVEEYVSELSALATKVGELSGLYEKTKECEYVKGIRVSEVDLGSGKARIELLFDDELYYKVISDLCGIDIPSEEMLIETFCSLAKIKEKYDRISAALEDAENIGYGIVVPEIKDMKLEEPKIVKHSGGYGVSLKASAPSIHIIKATIETEIDPVVGSEQQSEELLKFLLSEFEEDPAKIWETNLFGKTLHELVNEGLHSKLENMPEDARLKLSETLGRIINEGSGGLICIIL